MHNSALACQSEWVRTGRPGAPGTGTQRTLAEPAPHSVFLSQCSAVPTARPPARSRVCAGAGGIAQEGARPCHAPLASSRPQAC